MTIIKSLKLILTLCAVLCFNIASAAVDPSQIHKMLQQSGSAITGIVVKDASTGRIIYQENPNRLFVPASSLKVYTGAAALIMLGPNFHFPTNVYTDARTVQPGILKGNVYVTFSGDPTLTSSDLIDVLSILQKQGITQIQGNVIIVPPDYTTEKYAPGTLEKDRIHPYGAPITPVIVDQNAFSFILQSTSPGKLALVSASEPNDRIHITHDLYTKSAANKVCGLNYHLDDNNQLDIRGCLPPRSTPYVERIALKNPMNYALGVIEVALRHWNVTVHGHVLAGNPGQMAHSAKLLNSHASEALPIILAKTLKPSNNVLASALYLKVGQTYWHKKATWENSGIAIKQVLEKYAGVPMQSATIVDGAGLSRNNRVTPLQTADLLVSMQNKFLLSDDFISALPVPGQKGTMIHRHIGPYNLQNHIHAKTGTMKGIIGLSGYLPSANHHTLVFSIMTNSTSDLVYSSDKIALASWKYRDLEDQICGYLMKSNV